MAGKHAPAGAALPRLDRLLHVSTCTTTSGGSPAGSPPAFRDGVFGRLPLPHVQIRVGLSGSPPPLIGGVAVAAGTVGRPGEPPPRTARAAAAAGPGIGEELLDRRLSRPPPRGRFP